MENSKIEWTDHTFNPWVGCMKVSPGCKHCYAERDMTRYPKWANTWGPASTTQRIRTSAANWKKPLAWNRKAEREGRYRVFCASVADWLEDHPQLPAWRADLLRLIWQTPHLDWLLLSKRPENWADMLHAVVQSEDDGVDWWASRWLDGEYPPNVWMGTSVEDQANADVRIPALLEIPAAIHFLSVEPLLGPVDIASMGIYFTNPDGGGGGYALYPLTGETWFGFGEEPDFGNLIDWLIVGGESGPQARPMHPDWVRSIRDQCRDAGTAFFFKQWGEWGISTLNALGATPKRTLHRFEDGVVMEKVGKHKAGRFLDGRTWGEFPVVEFTTEEVSNV